MIKTNKLPEGASITKPFQLPLKLTDSTIHPYFPESQYISLMSQKYTEVYDKEGKPMQMADGYETNYFRQSDEEIIDSFCWMTLKKECFGLTWKGKNIEYIFDREYSTFYASIQKGINLLNNDEYTIISIDHHYSDSYSIINKLDFSIYPYLEYITSIGGSYGRDNTTFLRVVPDYEFYNSYYSTGNLKDLKYRMHKSDFNFSNKIIRRILKYKESSSIDLSRRIQNRLKSIHLSD